MPNFEWKRYRSLVHLGVRDLTTSGFSFGGLSILTYFTKLINKCHKLDLPTDLQNTLGG